MARLPAKKGLQHVRGILRGSWQEYFVPVLLPYDGVQDALRFEPTFEHIHREHLAPLR